MSISRTPVAKRSFSSQYTSIEYPSGKLASLTRKKNEILEFIHGTYDENCDLVRENLKKYYDRLINFKEACQALLNEALSHNIPQDQIDAFKHYMNKNYGEDEQFRNKIEEWLNESKSKNGNSIAPKDSISVASGHSRASSKRSSTSSLRIRIAEERAKNEADKMFHESKIRLEEEIKTRKAEEETKRIDEERRLRDLDIKKSAQFVKNLQKELDAIEVSSASRANLMPLVSNISETEKTATWINQSQEQTNFCTGIKQDESVPTSDKIPFFEIMQKQNELSSMMIKNYEKSSLPKTEPDVFDGLDLAKYISFIRSFHSLIANKCQTDSDRLYYLEKYTVGEPQELVRSCTQKDPSVGYHTALQLLHEEYGNEFKISNSYLKKLELWPDIQNEDGKAMRALSVFITSCANVMEDMKSLNQLNSPSEMMKILFKLPYKYRERWRNHTYNLMKREITVDFKQFTYFIKEQSSIMNQPIFGDIVDPKRDKRKPNVTKDKKAFATLSSNQSNNDKFCVACKKTNHLIENCIFFGKNEHEDKVKFIKEQGLCFSCLRKGHSSKGCLDRPTCKKCSRRHLTIMHNEEYIKSLEKLETNKSNSEVPNADTSESSNHSSSSTSFFSKHTGAGERVFCSAIPVKLKIKGSENVVTTYAGLDGFCTDVFMNEELIEQLGAKTNKNEISLTTMEGIDRKHTAKVINNLEILDLDENENYTIPVVYCKPDWPFNKDDTPKQEDIKGFSYLKEVPFKFINKGIGILIGMKMIDLLKPLKIIDGPPGLPYASLHKLGWAFNGAVNRNLKSSFSCHLLKVDSNDINSKFEALCAQDFKDGQEVNYKKSIEDKKWEKIVTRSINKTDYGHFEVDLPFKEENFTLPYNREQVLGRLNSSKRRMKNNQKYYEEYKNFMNMMLDMGYAERVPTEELCKDDVWYLTHFGVYHKVKNKLRIVFDCSLKYHGVSLNDTLFQGPDLTSNLFGILLRFRQEPVAFVADIQKMFYQVYVSAEHTDYMRFLWYPNGNFDAEPVEYRVKVHIFGAVSSPSISNFVLQHTALTHECSNSARETVLNSFYVDDLVKSCQTEIEAKNLAHEVKDLVSMGGFNLTSFVSNSTLVLESLASKDLANNVKEKDLSNTGDSPEGVLGVVWNVERDSITFKLNITDQPSTKRGILSTIFSLFDPFGIVSPVTLTGKRLFQQACDLKLKWDEDLPQPLYDRWNSWLKYIHVLKDFEISRCYKIKSDIKSTQLHIFSDGSEIAYAAVAYLRFEDASNHIHCAFVAAKTRLVPLSRSTLTTIPRIELNGAKLGVELMIILRRELEIHVDGEYFWTDSETVLKYIGCENKRFHTFVTNRVAFIRSHTEINNWNHVPGKLNPADLGSRGALPREFLKSQYWKHGPEYLWKPTGFWPKSEVGTEVLPNDQEIKSKSFTLFSQDPSHSPTLMLLESSSNWLTIKLRVAWLLRLKNILFAKDFENGNLTAEEIKGAEKAICKFIQLEQFGSTIVNVKSGKSLPKTDKLRKLCPFLDEENILRVGGRIENSLEEYNVKHPIILPESSNIAKLIIEDLHIRLGHLGRRTILSTLRQSYWIIGGNGLVRRIVKDCIICRKVQGKPNQQLMANLPKERVIGDEPPFTNVGIDCFGPYFVTRKRSTEKRYGLIFTCLASRAIHLECLYSLDTDSFINGLRRFYCRRGSVKVIYSDNGTNFVGGQNELRAALVEWNNMHTEKWMQQNCIEWKFNPPHASHFGGVWEREIRSVRKILNSILLQQPLKLNDENLNTLLCEVEGILNSRPLCEYSEDTSDLEMITPNHLLQLKSEATFPPGLFNSADLYCRRRWKQVQYLADLFWKRWKKEYLPLLQQRQKWTTEFPSHQVGNIVLLVDPTQSRNNWPIGRIVDTIADDQGRVRIVDVKISKMKEGKGTTIVRRPISKMILLRSVKS